MPRIFTSAAAAQAHSDAEDVAAGLPFPGVPATPAPKCVLQHRAPTAEDVAAMAQPGAAGYGWTWHAGAVRAHPTQALWVFECMAPLLPCPVDAIEVPDLTPDWTVPLA